MVEYHFFQSKKQGTSYETMRRHIQSKQKENTPMQRELSYGTICLRVFLKLKIYVGSNANKIMLIKITEDKSIKIHGNRVHRIFSNSSKMYFKIIST